MVGGEKTSLGGEIVPWWRVRWWRVCLVARWPVTSLILHNSKRPSLLGPPWRKLSGSPTGRFSRKRLRPLVRFADKSSRLPVASPTSYFAYRSVSPSSHLACESVWPQVISPTGSFRPQLMFPRHCSWAGEAFGDLHRSPWSTHEMAKCVTGSKCERSVKKLIHRQWYCWLSRSLQNLALMFKP